MTKNAKVIFPAKATSATQTTSWEWSAPYFVKRAQEVQARLDLQRQTMNDLQGQYKNLQNQNRNLQDQKKDQKKNHERELHTCTGTFIVVLLTFAAFMICGFLPSSSPEHCSSALEAKAVQMTATPTTVTVTLPIAINAVPTIEAASAIKATSSTEAAQPTKPFWKTLTHEQIMSVIRDYDKIQGRYRDNQKAWQREQDTKRKANMQKMIAQWAKNMAEKRRREEEAQEQARKQL
ncbi:hypothetical protein J4E86_008470 [Alternaria arbusti]|uniref:uncharacterized protein n=1 Tax=Alternaria arbusti TaxID=232088 RepID=UPI00221F7656|nr:uncharacterized protein J4E86_008470 [Alternaria arbusti]KAI4947953.1 hypothetical protein J4E86_008470 [Alternaria arbusti]